MGRASREKGIRGELEVRDVFEEYDFDVERVPNSGGLLLKGDLYTRNPIDLPIHVEVKRVGVRLNWWEALEQMESERGDKHGLLCVRRDRGEWYGVMRLRDILSLHRSVLNQ